MHVDKGVQNKLKIGILAAIMRPLELHSGALQGQIGKGSLFLVMDA